MPLLALIALFLVVPFVELYVIIEVVGPALGAPLTILLLAADSIIGALLFKSQGRSVWRRFNRTMAEGKVPHREVVDGVLVIFGGSKLPQLARSLGQAQKEFKSGLADGEKPDGDADKGEAREKNAGEGDAK